MGLKPSLKTTDWLLLFDFFTFIKGGKGSQELGSKSKKKKGRQNKGINIQETSSLIKLEAIGYTSEGRQNQAKIRKVKVTKQSSKKEDKEWKCKRAWAQEWQIIWHQRRLNRYEGGRQGDTGHNHQPLKQR